MGAKGSKRCRVYTFYKPHHYQINNGRPAGSPLQRGEAMKMSENSLAVFEDYKIRRHYDKQEIKRTDI